MLTHHLMDCVMHKILKRGTTDPKEMKIPKFDPEEKITFNTNFDDKRRRFVIVPRPLK